MPRDDGAGLVDDLDDLSLDELIEQINFDAYGDEDYWSFRQAFQDAVHFPHGCDRHRR